MNGVLQDLEQIQTMKTIKIEWLGLSTVGTGVVRIIQTHQEDLQNQIGSPVVIVNADTGVIVQEITYDEFGNILSDSSPGFTPFGFAACANDKAGMIKNASIENILILFFFRASMLTDPI